MRYYLDRDRERPEWVICEGTAPENGVVVLTLPDYVPRGIAELARGALSRARAQGRREVADAVAHHAQGLRLAEQS